MDVFVTPIKKATKRAIDGYKFVTQPRRAQMGRYDELYPERYTSIISTLPEVDISDESLDTSCVLNRSRNTSLEDKGVQSADFLSAPKHNSTVNFGTNFVSPDVRQRRPRVASPSPVQRVRKRRPKSGLERGLAKVGIPEMNLASLFIPLLIIIAVFAITSSPDVDTTMNIIKADIETSAKSFDKVEPSEHVVETINEIEPAHTMPDDYVEIAPETPQTDPEVELQPETDPILPEEPTPEPVVEPIPEPVVNTVDYSEEIELKVTELRDDLVSATNAKMADLYAKLDSMTKKLEDAQKKDEILEQMTQRINEDSERIDALTKRLSEKEETLTQLKTDLNRQMNFTSSVAQAIDDTTPKQAVEQLMESTRQQHNKIKEIETRFNQQIEKIEAKIEDFQRTREESSKKADEIIVDTIESSIQSLRHKLNIISADKTGMADFALESAGAEIVSEWTSRGLSSNAAMIKIWNVPIFYHTVSARTALQPDVNPGNCFAFGGEYGTIGIRLSRQVVVQNVTLEHIPKEISLNGNIDSAPRDFTVYGIDSGEKTELGRFVYNINDLPIQTFSVKNDIVYHTVQFEFKSNWGAEHTCIYRIRVHGTH